MAADRTFIPQRTAFAGALLAFALLSPTSGSAAGEAGDRLMARTFDSGFALAHDTYNGMGTASDGRIYYVLSSESHEAGGRMFRYDPAADRIEPLGDLTEACGEKGLKTIVQGKAHVNFVESAGKLYFSTHVGFYSLVDGMEKIGIPPEGFKPYPGGHFLAYDISSGKFELLARAPRGEGILSMAMDTHRGRLFGLTWPTGCFLRYDLATKDLKDLGKTSRDGENGKGDQYRTLCRSLVVDPRDGSCYFTDGDGDIFRYVHDRDSIEKVEGEDVNMRKDYFGLYDPTSPGHMGYNWRQTFWSEADGAIYGVHGNSGYLFRFNPKIPRVEVLDRITSTPSKRSGMFDQFSYGYLGFALGPDGRTIHYLTGGPVYVDGKRVTGKKATAMGESKGTEDLHLMTYDIPTGACTDQGAIFYADGQRPAYVNSIAIGKDGTVYTLARITEKGKTRADLIRIPGPFGAKLSAGPVEAPKPRIIDALQPVRLTRPELSGEIGRRLEDLIYKNFMVLDLDRDFLEPFRKRPPADGWRYIGVGKVIDAGAKFGAFTGDPEIRKRTSWLIEELMKTRDPDGYLGHMKAEPEGRQNTINWILHDQEYALLGLTDNYLYNGDGKSLEWARQLADYILKTFPRNPHPEKVCTAGLPEAMLTLYGSTGDRRYLRFAASTRHGYDEGEVDCSSLRDWKQTFENPKRSHVYVMLARCYAQTLLYRWEPSERLLEMSRFMLGELLRRDGGLLIIGSGSDGEHFAYEQNGQGAISESCVTAYLIRWLDSLMRLEGDLRLGDVMERAVFNALFAAQDPAGRRIRYFTPFAGPREYFGSDGFCCPGNYRRIVAELPGMVCYRTSDGGIAVNLYSASKATVDLGGGRRVAIEQRTDYPTSGSVTITVTPSEPLEFPLRLRIPRWCPKATVAVGGGAPFQVSPGGKHHEIRRVWSPGDTIALEMPMPWRLVRGRKLQEGRVALMRGPVVYCIGTDRNAGLLEKVKEPCDLTVDPGSLGLPVADGAIRPSGWKVAAKAWPPGPRGGSAAASLDVELSEFIDQSGVSTYFRIPDPAAAVDDELTGGK